jgi:hypothetical protein
MIRASDRQLRVIVPLVSRAARDTPHPALDDLVGELAVICARRGLLTVLADMERIAAGGEVAPLPVVDVLPAHKVYA